MGLSPLPTTAQLHTESQLRRQPLPLRPLFFSYLRQASRLPAWPLPSGRSPTHWPPGQDAEGFSLVPQHPWGHEVGGRCCGDDRAAPLLLQSRKQAQRGGVICPRPHSRWRVWHLLEPCLLAPLGVPAQHTGGPPSAPDVPRGQGHTHQNSPSSCTVTPIFSRSLLLTFRHSSELGCEHRGREEERVRGGTPPGPPGKGGENEGCVHQASIRVGVGGHRGLCPAPL